MIAIKFTINTVIDDLRESLSKIEEHLIPIITFLKLSNDYDWLIIVNEEKRYGKNADTPITYEFNDFESFRDFYIGNHINTITEMEKSTASRRFKESSLEVHLQINMCESFIKF